MTNTLVLDAMKLVRTGMEDTMRLVRRSLAELAPSQKKALTPKQQLERFLSMTPEGFDQLRKQYGEESFGRYMIRMRQLAEEVV